jgi:hypothetical protein
MISDHNAPLSSTISLGNAQQAVDESPAAASDCLSLLLKTWSFVSNLEKKSCGLAILSPSLLAVKAKALEATKKIAEWATIVSPETLLKWYRGLIAKKYDGGKKRGRGKPSHR